MGNCCSIRMPNEELNINMQDNERHFRNEEIGEIMNKTFVRFFFFVFLSLYTNFKSLIFLIDKTRFVRSMRN